MVKGSQKASYFDSRCCFMLAGDAGSEGSSHNEWTGS
jgi:hypothetical protein